MHEESVHRQLDPELQPLLLQFHVISGQHLRRVWSVYQEGSVDKIALGFDQDSLVVEANIADDTITFQVICSRDLNMEDWVNTSSCQPWNTFIGQPFDWGWITINQQDALDGILISFDGITPQVMLNVMASSINVSLISEPRS